MTITTKTVLKPGDQIDFMRSCFTVRQVNGNRIVMDTPDGLTETRTVDAHRSHLIGLYVSQLPHGLPFSETAEEESK